MLGRVSSAVALLLCASVPQGSALASAPLEVAAADNDGTAEFAAYQQALSTGQYKEALAIANRLKPEADQLEGRGFVAGMRGAALIGLKRADDARKQLDEAHRLSPQDPTPTLLSLVAALSTDQPVVGSDMFDRLVARFPDVVRTLESELVWHVLRTAPKTDATRNDDRRIALARLGWGGDLPAADWMALDAIKVLMKRKDTAGAAELLRYVDEPQVIENLLIQKPFEALWPQLEAHAGPQLAKVRASAVAAAHKIYDAAPDDSEALATLANALRHSGQLDDAIALRAKLPATSQAMALADEQTGWAVNNIALALHEAGRADDADALFASLNDAVMPQEHWRVSMKINRLELLVKDGKFARAMPLIEPTARIQGSPYADQLVRRLRFCTLVNSGQAPEAAKRRAEMMKYARDAYHATVDGLLCAGDLDAAEALVLEAASEDDFSGDLVRSLQPVSLTSDDPSIWTDRWQALRKRPRIAALYERLGRDMPERLVVPRPAKQPTVAKQ